MACGTAGSGGGATRSYDRTMVLLPFVKDWTGYDQILVCGMIV